MFERAQANVTRGAVLLMLAAIVGLAAATTSEASGGVPATHASGDGTVTAQQIDLPLMPATGSQKSIGLRDAPARRHQQREREIGGRVGQNAGRVGNHDAALGCCGNVDVVEAYGDIGDHFQRARSVHDGRIDLVRELTHNSILVGDGGPQVVRR